MDTTADDIETLHDDGGVECLAPPHDPHQRTTVRPVTTTRCPGCGNPVRSYVACSGCFATVPRHLVRALNRTDPMIDVTEHVNARQAIVTWLAGPRIKVDVDVSRAEHEVHDLRQRMALHLHHETEEQE